MDATITLLCLLAAAFVVAIAVWRDHRPRTDLLKVRWIPWRVIILITSAAILYLAVHLANLAGFTTGQPGARF